MAFSHSFLIPSHNQGQFLGATIESLLNQDDPCSEIVISEDYSTDNSLEIAQSYARRYPERIRLTRPPEHKGMFPNWNWGLSQITTEWVSVMGSDDQALPNFVTTMREGIARTPNVVVVGANWHFVDGNDNILFTEKVLSLPEIMHPPQTFYMQLFANRVHPAAHCFRRDAWEKVGGFHDDVKLYGDWAFWLRLTPLGDFVHMRRVIARYRINYRAGLQIARMNQSIQDELTLRLDLIPKIARQFPHVPQWRLTLASRRRFRHMLHRISLDLNGSDPSEQVKLFEPWAHELGPGALRLLDRFARSEPIGLDWLDSNVILPARELYKLFQPTTPPQVRRAGDGSGENAKLSIVVPVESADTDWAVTIDSALRQTTASETVAVVPADDAALRAAVEKVVGDRGRVVVSPANAEHPAAAGIAAAYGNWIVVARPGIKLAHDFATTLADLALRTPGVSALIAGAGYAAWPRNLMRIAAESAGEPPLFAFRKSAWEAVGGYQPEMRALHDRALLLKLAAHGACGGLPVAPMSPAPIDEWDRLRDTEFLHRTLIPTLVSRRGGVSRPELEQAGRIALRRLVTAASSFDQAGRERAAELLTDWADNLHEPDLVEALRTGQPIGRPRPLTGTKRRLGSFYRALR
ncbi:MAG TPA: glycosyltransferase [Reyranellaceae bacterium]|nr:glycosyltransferase [Reyranellaceae bacterium]